MNTNECVRIDLGNLPQIALESVIVELFGIVEGVVVRIKIIPSLFECSATAKKQDNKYYLNTFLHIRSTIRLIFPYNNLLKLLYGTNLDHVGPASLCQWHTGCNNHTITRIHNT